MSHNYFSGEIPKHLELGCISLIILKLSNNLLHGQIFSTNSNLTNLRYLYLDNNKFSGRIPYGLSDTSLALLDISKNNISGGLPSWIGDLSYLHTLVMAKNHLEGFIPVEFCNLQELHILDISENNLYGSIPSCFNKSSLEHLHLQGNGLNGPISRASLNNSSLVTLDIRDNNFSGSIPKWIGGFSNLRILLLKGNNFQGPIPLQICQLNLLSIMDLSHNNLFGSIPACFNNISFGRRIFVGDAFMQKNYPMGFFSVYSSSYKKFLRSGMSGGCESMLEDHKEVVEFITKKRLSTYEGGILNFMSGADLSWNQLTGEIPSEIGNLSAIRALNLSNNHLSGSIPVTFSNLKEIESLDLSYNKLSGRIPSQLIALTFMSSFSVAHNNLSGSIPAWIAQFATFEETSYEGNSGLCGPPLNKSCTTMPKSSDKEQEDGVDGANNIVTFYASFAMAYITWFFGFMALIYLNHNWQLMCFRCMDIVIDQVFNFVLYILGKLECCIEK
eukprot:TRINITY_DN9233_c0_g1_i1.p1 TRINITY_DN9233_c0_g1~~TRINITY_DN9233_c0_g1_i1.p1  ORF type:complete len:536 (+),score=67.55 TRINITY_DN9233_c0_g1_i1:108-1610(+)